MIEPMLAHRYDKHAKKVVFPCGVSPKLDGVRAIWQAGRLFTRNGKEWQRHQLPHVFEELEAKVPPGVTVDGELYRHGWPCWRINGAVAVKRLGPSDDTAEVRFHAFDIIGDGTFIERHDALRALGLETVPFFTVGCCHDDIDLMARRFVEQGYEGAMVRNLDAPYEHKRSFHVLKHKAFEDAEFRCVGAVEGEGKHAGRLGALVLEGGHQCGTGFTDEQREALWRDPPVGKSITVRFFETTESGAPRFPSFVAVRDYE